MDTQNSETKKIKTDEDRLSTLHDDMLLEILSRTTSYKEALKCSAISKRFRHLHYLLPHLYFSESETAREDLITMMLSSALENRHVLETFSFTAADSRGFDDWRLYCFANYSIKHLTLQSMRRKTLLDGFPFSCKDLVTLNLYDVECTPSSNSSFPELQKCTLRLTNHNPFWYNDFLKNCPVLHHLKLDAPFSSTDSPYTLSSPSLQSLQLHLLLLLDVDPFKGVKIRLEMPLLSQLNIDCIGFASKSEVKIQSPKLQEITVKKCSGQYFPFIQCNQVVWKDGVFLKRAQWNSRKDLVYLDLETAVMGKLLELKDLGPYATLEALTVSDFVVSTFRIVEMLYQLPLLESLTLSYCSFENEDLHASNCQDADWVVSENSATDDILYTKGFDRDMRLREVSIDFHDYLFLGSSQAREMLLLFWKKLPCLKRFTVAVSSKKEDLNDANCCLHFFSSLLYHGNSVHMHRKDRSTEFQLIKKTA